MASGCDIRPSDVSVWIQLLYQYNKWRPHPLRRWGQCAEAAQQHGRINKQTTKTKRSWSRSFPCRLNFLFLSGLYFIGQNPADLIKTCWDGGYFDLVRQQSECQEVNRCKQWGQLVSPEVPMLFLFDLPPSCVLTRADGRTSTWNVSLIWTLFGKFQKVLKVNKFKCYSVIIVSR